MSANFETSLNLDLEIDADESSRHRITDGLEIDCLELGTAKEGVSDGGPLRGPMQLVKF